VNPRPGEIVFPAARRIARDPVQILQADTPREIRTALEAARAAVARGLTAAGYLAYEAGPAFDPAFRAHPPAAAPLLWLGLYRGLQPFDLPAPARFPVPPRWTPALDAPTYRSRIAEIHQRIGAGETYQVNYAFPMTAQLDPEGAWDYFLHLYAAQPTPYACYIDTGPQRILSLSPELFFRTQGGRIHTRPMKGTRPRAPRLAEDTAVRDALCAAEKDRAENLMIVDMVRNDLGRIAPPGAIHVESLFDAERYATVWQMTSTITADSHAEVPEILAALFPSASVTGAPKIQTSTIIHALEPWPRGAYCGAIGRWEPGGTAEFSVGIRTMTIETTTGQATYPVGSGVTWDSTSAGEYEECLDKAAVLLAPRPPFSLFETLRWEAGGCRLIEYHLARLAESASYFSFPMDAQSIRVALEDAARTWNSPMRVRLTLAPTGAIEISAESPPAAGAPVRLGFARTPVDPRDPFLAHKTTHRAADERARAEQPESDDVILWNTRGEVTETTIGNIVIERDGQLLTPMLESGLLAGCMRAHLIDTGEIAEARLTQDDVRRADRIYRINALRGWCPATLVEE